MKYSPAEKAAEQIDNDLATLQAQISITKGSKRQRDLRSQIRGLRHLSKLTKGRAH